MPSILPPGKIQARGHPREILCLYTAVIVSCSLAASLLSLQASAYLVLAFCSTVFLLVYSPSLSTWLLLYLASVLTVPPFYPDRLGGELPVFLSHGILVMAGLVALRDRALFQWNSEPVSQSIAGLLLSLGLSLPFAFWLSGSSVGFSSCLKLVLILQPFLVYVMMVGFGLVSTEQAHRRILRILLISGALSATYGALDFYFPIPVAHPFADQYIYLLSGAIRRAQGIFYEASSFGNLCAFFWSFCLVTLTSAAHKNLRLSRVTLGLLMGLFTLALFLSYSRGAWANASVTVAVFLLLEKRFKFRFLVTCALMSSLFLLVIYEISPELVTHFAERRLEPLLEIWRDPNTATSGRWEAWNRLFEYFAEHPGLLFFGVGYKSISTTSLLGQNLVVDNGYLSLLFETGIAGLLAFLWFVATLFTAFLKVRDKAGLLRSHCATFLIAFWCGQLVQMLTGDILTYWRNMVIFFAMAACVLQFQPEESAVPSQPEPA